MMHSMFGNGSCCRIAGLDAIAQLVNLSLASAGASAPFMQPASHPGVPGFGSCLPLPVNTQPGVALLDQGSGSLSLTGETQMQFPAPVTAGMWGIWEFSFHFHSLSNKHKAACDTQVLPATLGPAVPPQ